MSHRVTVQTAITNKEFAVEAMTKLKIQHQVKGSNIYLSSGNFAGSTLNLTTGELVSGDTDHVRVTTETFGILRQTYAEVQYRAEAFQQGIDILGREVLKDGTIKLVCRMA